MASKEVLAEVLKCRVACMTQREREFATGLVQFYEAKGYWSDKQFDGARKLAVRLITERDSR